jgi:hypothetical protein
MKQVIKYQSDSGFLFDTEREAKEEDIKFAYQREIAKSIGEDLYIYLPPGTITMGGMHGMGRKVY